MYSFIYIHIHSYIHSYTFIYIHIHSINRVRKHMLFVRHTTSHLYFLVGAVCAETSLHPLIVLLLGISFQSHTQWTHIDTLKLSVVGISALHNLKTATNQGCFCMDKWLVNIYQHTTGNNYMRHLEITIWERYTNINFTDKTSKFQKC